MLDQEFGINTNILETNIINLTVVIGVLIYVGGDVLNSLLKTRKENILKSLTDAEQKYQETLDALNSAKETLALAKQKALDINNESIRSIEQRNAFLISKANDDMKRLEESQQTTITLEEDKILRKLCAECSQSALTEAMQKVQKRLSKDKFLHRKLIDVNISILSKLVTTKSKN